MTIQNEHHRPKRGTASIPCSAKHVSLSDSRRLSPFFGWGWLGTPAVVLMAVGMLGVLRVYAETLGARLDVMKFPPLFACGVLVVGGAILLAISWAGRCVPLRRQVDPRPGKSWRTF
jgi:hypothetical protein